MWHVRRQESAILWSMCLTWTYCWWKKSCSWYGKYLRIYVLDIPGGAGFLKHQQYVWHQHWASFSCQHGASFSWKTSIVFHHTPGRAALFLPYTSKRLLTRCQFGHPKTYLKKTPNLNSYLDIWMSRVGKPLYLTMFVTFLSFELALNDLVMLPCNGFPRFSL